MKIYVLWAGLLLAGVVSCLPSIDTKYVCDGKVDGYHCASCLQPIYCNSSLSTPATVLPSCDEHYVCEEFSPTIAGCTQESTATNCSCSNSTNFCDPYTDSYLSICTSQSIVDVQDCGDGECRLQQCVDQPSCAGVPNETCVHDPTVCNFGYLCFNEKVVRELSCPAGTYLTEYCLCFAPVAAPCSDFCAGNCPDVTNCHQYYVCDGVGNVLSGPLACPNDTYYFNPNANPPTCGDDASQCSSLTSCGFVYNREGDQINVPSLGIPSTDFGYANPWSVSTFIRSLRERALKPK